MSKHKSTPNLEGGSFGSDWNPSVDVGGGNDVDGRWGAFLDFGAALIWGCCQATGLTPFLNVAIKILEKSAYISLVKMLLFRI